jgi:hypothetical protein
MFYPKNKVITWQKKLSIKDICMGKKKGKLEFRDFRLIESRWILQKNNLLKFCLDEKDSEKGDLPSNGIIQSKLRASSVMWELYF